MRMQNSPIQTKPFSELNNMRRRQKSSVEATITQYRLHEGTSGTLFIVQTQKQDEEELASPHIRSNFWE